uniref:Uncharacterized protein orf113b n=1 Tax=Beta vulgaris subsp. maritima TaxID=350892 RepID=E8ZC36_BETVM|nr:hypothetical protein [Beta vulgaris subsp. maritima]
MGLDGSKHSRDSKNAKSNSSIFKKSSSSAAQLVNRPGQVPQPGSPVVQPTLSSETKPVTRSQHGLFKPDQHGLLTHVTIYPIPRNPVSALKDPNWKMAMDDSFNALIKKKTWD